MTGKRDPTIDLALVTGGFCLGVLWAIAKGEVRLKSVHEFAPIETHDGEVLTVIVSGEDETYQRDR